jgi:integrase
MITLLGIKAAQNKAKQKNADVFLSDDTGQRLGWRLSLRCLPSGSATWIFRYTHNGKRHQINLGNFQTLDISSARCAAAEYAAIYRETSDVLGKLRADEHAKQASIKAEQAKLAADLELRQRKEKYTLQTLMELYVDYLNKQGKITAARNVISLSKHLISLANKPAAEVSKHDLVTIQRKLLDAGKGRTANKLRSYVRAAYALVLRADSDATAPALALDFATAGGVEANPAALLAVAKGFNKTHDRVLTDDELFMLLDHAKKSGVIGLAVRAAILLGGQRMAQLLRATISDVQGDFLVLHDPKGKRELPRKHPIPLEGMAETVISEAIDRAKSMGTNWLFSSNGKVKLNPDTVSHYINKRSCESISSGISKAPFKLADLRRTIETQLSKMKVPKETRAYLQSHGLSGVQTRHYDRHDYEQEKRSALKLLHQWIESRGTSQLTMIDNLEAGAKIIPIHRKA